MMHLHPALLWLIWVSEFVGLLLMFRYLLRWCAALARIPL